MKKIFTLFAALAMVMSMSAATKTVYFKTQEWWHKDGAASAAYYWGTGGNANAWPGTRMTKVSGETNMWSIDIDTDKYQNIIFTRVNGSGNVEYWGAKTVDLPTNNANLFTLSTTEVWGDPGAAGNWSVYAPDAPKSYKDITITVIANATPKIHYWEGGDKMVGSDWENKPEMVATGEENTYSYTIKDVDEATGVNYLIVVGELQSADKQAFENVTVNFKDLLPQVAVMGVTGWTGDKMTVADDYLSASVTLTLEAAKDYEIKLTVDGGWFGSKAIAITKENNSASFAENGEGNGKLTTDLAGDYVFTYTYATKTLVVTYPVEPEYDMEITCTNLKTESEANMTYFMGSDATGMEINLTILNFDEKGTYEVEGSLNAGGEWFNLAGTATYDYSEELEADVLVAEVTANGEMSLLITMYKKVLVPTETITVENMTKTIQRLGWAQTLRLDGEHETYGQVTIMVTGCDGAYGTYNTTVYLNGESLSLTGEGDWKNDGEVDVLEVIGELEDGSKVVKVIGKTPAEEAKEPIELHADVTFTVDEWGDLNLVGEANTGEVIDIWVASWADNGYGEYAAGEVWGTIDGVDVSNKSEAVTIEQEGLVAYVYALLEDMDGNIYKLTAGGMAPAWEGGEGEEDDTKLTVNDADIAPGLVNTSNLELYGFTSDWKEINVVLKNGTTKLYGDYTAEELEIMVDWEEATLATGTVASYYELEGVAVFEATVLLGEKTYELTISGTPWVDPSTIVPTETIELEFANAEIKYQYGGLNITAANGDANLVLKINTTADAMYGSFTFDDLFQFVSSVVVGDDEISFIYGTVVVEEVKEGEYTYDKVTTSLLGANYKLYNMVATTTPKSTPTGLDNLDTTVAPAKAIVNGQLVIIKNGVQYNAQGAVVK